jgi:beta-phosphoglucomutase
MPIRAVIFDFNGVLVDDEHVHFELFRETLAAEGIVLDEATYHDRYLGFDDQGCFWNALRDNGRDPSDTLINDLIARKAVRYAEVAETGLSFFPHAAETLTNLATNRPVAICSGALRAEIEYALKRLEVRHLVHSITSAEDTDRCKPDPQGYLLALDRLRADHPDLLASECLVIEDSIAGLQAASVAGMIAVGVTHTYSRDELKIAKAVDVIEGLDRITADWVQSLPIAPLGLSKRAKGSA